MDFHGFELPDCAFMQAALVAVLPIAVVLAVTAIAPAFAEPACLADGAAIAHIKSIDDRLEMVLDDDRRIVLAGLEPPMVKPGETGLAEQARERLAASAAGREVRIRLLATLPDRWGRLPALVFATEAGEVRDPPVSLAQALIAEGLARVRISPVNPCLRQFLEAETQARASGLPIWADPDTAVIAAQDSEAFVGREGSLVIVEGQVSGIGASGYRTWLNFGPNHFRDFSVTILKPNLKIFDKVGLSLQSLTGQRLRVRGLLDLRFGPQIEIADPAAIEVLGAGNR